MKKKSNLFNPLVPSVLNKGRVAKILIYEGILKEISYDRRDYESVDEKSHEKRRKKNPGTNGLHTKMIVADNCHKLSIKFKLLILVLILHIQNHFFITSSILNSLYRLQILDGNTAFISSRQIIMKIIFQL